MYSIIAQPGLATLVTNGLRMGSRKPLVLDLDLQFFFLFPTESFSSEDRVNREVRRERGRKWREREKQIFVYGNGDGKCNDE
jgi:hypothetical protein